MSVSQFLVTWLSLSAAVILSLVAVVVYCHERQVIPGGRLLHRFRSLPWYAKIVLIVLVAQCIVHGSTKTNQTSGTENGMTNAPPFGLMFVHPADIPQPEVGRLPESAVLAQNWWRRGCWEDLREVAFDDEWVFPCGSNHLSRVVVMSRGEIRTAVRDTNAVAALGVALAQVPFDTCFYHERTLSNSYRFVWDNAYADRNTNMPVMASVELFRNGDCQVTTNGVSRHIPRVIPFPHDGIGQDDEWVVANFTNATDILDIGYESWARDQVGIELTNGLYLFTANFLNAPVEATDLVVGGLSVCVTNAGEYVFVLEKGIEYSFHTDPYNEDVEYYIQDDMAPTAPLLTSWWGDYSGWTIDGGWSCLELPVPGGFGGCFWMPTLQGSPDVCHVESGGMTFVANLSDYRYAEAVAYHWFCNDDNVVISSPYSRETQISFSVFPSWSSAQMYVTASVNDYELVSELTWFSYGTNSTPQVRLSLEMPNAVLLNSNNVDNAKLRRMSIAFSSDVAADGLIRLSCVSGADKVMLWGTTNREAGVFLPATWNVDGFSGFEAYIEGVSTSESLGDVEFKVEYISDDGDYSEQSGNLTVVEVGEVSLPGAPADGLVILRGTSVALEVGCKPEAAAPLLSTLWETRRLKSDATYDDWMLSAANFSGREISFVPPKGGVYSVRTKVGLDGHGVDVREYKWFTDELDGLGLHEAGDPMSFGVVDYMWQKTLCDCARSYFGDSTYSRNSRLSSQHGFSFLPASTWKCNMFVAHRLRECGLPVSEPHTYYFNGLPPLANEWAGNHEIPGWTRVDSVEYIQPGWVVAHSNPGGSGHVGIVDFDGAGIAAGKYIVNRASPDFISGNCIYRKFEITEE